MDQFSFWRTILSFLWKVFSGNTCWLRLLNKLYYFCQKKKKSAAQSFKGWELLALNQRFFSPWILKRGRHCFMCCDMHSSLIINIFVYALLSCKYNFWLSFSWLHKLSKEKEHVSIFLFCNLSECFSRPQLTVRVNLRQIISPKFIISLWP